MDAQLAGQRVLVTGAAGAIGSAIAQALANEGAQVVLHCHRNRAAAEHLARSCRGSAVVQADLRDEAQARRLISEATTSGPLDGLVVNHGVWVSDHVPLHTMTLAQWTETLAADLTSVFLVCREFLAHLAARPREHASIVLLGSTAALFGEAGHADYAAAKAGVVYGLVRSLKNEIVALAPRGRVNAVCPGWVRTPMVEGVLQDPTVVARATATMPMAKVATPEDVAHAVVWLSSAALAGHISGAIVPVHGGMEGRLQRPP